MEFEDRVAALAALRWIAIGLSFILLFSYLLYLAIGTRTALGIIDDLLPRLLERRDLLENLVLQ